MAEQVIDFTYFSKKIILNPTVPLAVLDIYLRTGTRVQATILGKVYPSHVEVNEIIPNTTAAKFDYQEHNKRLDYLQTIYPNLEVLGGLFTDINIQQPQVHFLHTCYVNKDSGFKSKTNFTYPIILSIGTKLEDNNFKIQAYSYNPNFKSFGDLLNISAFQKWNVKLSFGSATTQQSAPLFTAINDQDQFLSNGGVKQIAGGMLRNLQVIRKHINKIINNQIPSNNQLGLNLKKILSDGLKSKRGVKQVSQKNTSDLQLVQYLSNVVNVNSVLASKFNKMQ